MIGRWLRKLLGIPDLLELLKALEIHAALLQALTRRSDEHQELLAQLAAIEAAIQRPVAQMASVLHIEDFTETEPERAKRALQKAERLLHEYEYARLHKP